MKFNKNHEINTIVRTLLIVCLIVIVVLFSLTAYGYENEDKENSENKTTQTTIISTYGIENTTIPISTNDSKETTITTEVTSTTTTTKETEITTNITTVTSEKEEKIIIPEEKVEEIKEEIIETIEIEEDEPSYIVFKPSTFYVHTSDCSWVDDTCIEITSTEDIECRKCTDCNPSIDIINKYIEPEESENDSYSTTYVKNFSRGTYYAYGGARYGGSGRNLIDCSIGDGTVKGSIASSYLYNNYGYNYNGKRTMVYLEISGYESMNGYYYLDDCDAGNSNVIDFFYYYNSNCQFQYQGVVSVECYIVNY